MESEMQTELPTDSIIDARISELSRRLDRRLVRRQRGFRLGVGLAAVALLGLGGTTAATAFFPSYLNFDGVVRSAYAQQFVDCVHSKGIPAVILDNTDAASILADRSLRASQWSVVRSRVVGSQLDAAGHAAGDCQTIVGKQVGQPIYPTQ
jgi:hypothetical protein